MSDGRTTIIYQSRDVLVRAVSAGSPLTQVVTFDHYDSGAGHDRPGFGERFLLGEGMDAIHILGRGNDWYQYADMPDVVAAVRAAIPDGARVLTYGSSMGGYTALRWAKALGAQCAIALSPQYTVDPSVVPWEDRWAQDGRRIDWIAAFNGPIARPDQSIVLFDPTGLDQRHAEMISRDIGSLLIRIPHASHPVGTFLAHDDLLRPLLRSAMTGTFDADAYQALVARHRKANPVYLSRLADVQPKHRPRTAVALAQKATEATPDFLLALHSLARALTRAGDHDAALEVQERLLPLIDCPEAYLPSFVETLLAAGRPDDAVAMARSIVPLDSRRAHQRHWMAWLLWQTGRRDEAIAEQAAACELDGGNAHFRKILIRYRWKRRSPGAYSLIARLRSRAKRG